MASPAVLRTEEARFAGLADFPFAPRYLSVTDARLGALRMAAIDEGPRDAPVALLLHGEPSWSYLYRTIIPRVTAAGFRAVAPDFIGFGRSDKPARRDDYSYDAFVGWLREFIEALDLTRITLVCQDWGGPIGLRVLAEQPAALRRRAGREHNPAQLRGTPARNRRLARADHRELGRLCGRRR